MFSRQKNVLFLCCISILLGGSLLYVLRSEWIANIFNKQNFENSKTYQICWYQL